MDQSSYSEPFLRYLTWLVPNAAGWIVPAYLIDAVEATLEHAVSPVYLVALWLVSIPFFQWLVLRPQGRWAVRWALVWFGSVVILLLIILVALLLSPLMIIAWPLGCMMVFAVSALGVFGMVLLNSHDVPYPPWMMSPTIVSVLSVIAGSFVLIATIERNGLVLSSVNAGVASGLVLPVFDLGMKLQKRFDTGR